MIRRLALAFPALMFLAACTTGGGGSGGPPAVVVIEGAYEGAVRVDANTCEPNPALRHVGESFDLDVEFAVLGDELEISFSAPGLGLPAFTLETRSFSFDPVAERLVFGFANLPLTASTGCQEAFTLTATLDFDTDAGTFEGEMEGDGVPAAAGCAGVPNPCVLDLTADGAR